MKFMNEIVTTSAVMIVIIVIVHISVCTMVHINQLSCATPQYQVRPFPMDDAAT